MRVRLTVTAVALSTGLVACADSGTQPEQEVRLRTAPVYSAGNVIDGEYIVVLREGEDRGPCWRSPASTRGSCTRRH